MGAGTLPGGAVPLDKVGGAWVDLGDKRWLKDARVRRARAAYAGRVEAEVVLLNERAATLRRKARRLPAGSNGRAKAELDAARLQALAHLLPAALTSAGQVVKHQPVGDRHERRAILLLNEIASVG